MRSIAYNFKPEEIADGDYHALFDVRRRDALFAFAFPQSDGSVLLGRDHLGNIPLFYRIKKSRVSASFHLPELLDGTESVSDEGLRTYLATGTVKTVPLFNEIALVPPGTVLKVTEGEVETLYQYRITPREFPSWSYADCLIEADRLLLQAAKRTLKEKTVGLYLSGGIDSALTGHYLKRAGADIHAYTATPWGSESTESRLAKLNAETIGVSSHSLVPLQTERYNTCAEESLTRYGNPFGASSQMAILCLLLGTEVGKERQVYFAQNCDTMNSSVPDQSLLFFIGLLPHSLRGKLHRSLGARSLVNEFVSFRTGGLIKQVPYLAPYQKRYSNLAQLGIAGMLFGHTPRDGDLVVLPSLVNNQLVSNLFYDMDVVEFALGIPLRYRLEWSPESKIGFAIGKRFAKTLAGRFLSPEVVHRKKGLTVPEGQDASSRTFFDSFPKRVGRFRLSEKSQRFAAEMLRQFSELPNAPKSLQTLFNPEQAEPIKASVAVLTYNSGKTVRRTLESLRAFADITVCDGGSNDDTLTIAKEFGAHVISQDTQFKNEDGTIADFSGIRNQTLAVAKHDWFLFIDSDEYLSPEAVEEIRAIVATPLTKESILAYSLPRKTVVEGVVIECATVYPNYQMRFFNRQGVTGFMKRVHERIALKEGVRTGKLTHPEYVPIGTEEELKRKQLRYLAIEVERHKNDTFLAWLTGPLAGGLKSSLSYAVRHVRIILFCRGTFMPLWVEWMHHWYNWKHITMTGYALLKRKKR